MNKFLITLYGRVSADESGVNSEQSLAKPAPTTQNSKLKTQNSKLKTFKTHD
ncbi:MAG: hypothetical protein KME08_16925 [Aphanothece sp. CMT-3BRIN-NPC111]|jgi:hypothetical protein|nr:hypothetical protein [Aphanothece sp. CMT-3BRIN-NPC111]